MEKRLERTQRQTQEMLDDADRFVSVVRVARAADRFLTRLL